MQRLRIKTSVPAYALPWPGAQISYDALGRPELLRYDYQSIRIEFEPHWDGDTNNLVELPATQYTRTITDQP
ncbi:MAG: hypothetical protein EVA65_15725 [Oceanococcus sp.]|nr:MAG: hypothetical protein EVA65_15725 [Oceanococcus sp.]